MMEINQVTVLVIFFGIYSSSGEYFHVFRKVSLKTEEHYSNTLNIFGMPACVRMFVSRSMLSPTGCGRLEWETALHELTVNT